MSGRNAVIRMITSHSRATSVMDVAYWRSGDLREGVGGSQEVGWGWTGFFEVYVVSGIGTLLSVRILRGRGWFLGGDLRRQTRGKQSALLVGHGVLQIGKETGGAHSHQERPVVCYSV